MKFYKLIRSGGQRSFMEQDEQASDRALSYGERAVGLNFNPSNDSTVQKLKELYAQIIDMLVVEPIDNGATSLRGRFLGRAINEAVSAQMWAVKAVTFKD